MAFDNIENLGRKDDTTPAWICYNFVALFICAIRSFRSGSFPRFQFYLWQKWPSDSMTSSLKAFAVFQQVSANVFRPRRPRFELFLFNRLPVDSDPQGSKHFSIPRVYSSTQRYFALPRRHASWSPVSSDTDVITMIRRTRGTWYHRKVTLQLPQRDGKRVLELFANCLQNSQPSPKYGFIDRARWRVAVSPTAAEVVVMTVERCILLLTAVPCRASAPYSGTVHFHSPGP